MMYFSPADHAPNVLLERFLRSRLGFPITLLFAGALLLVSEISYNSAIGSLDRAVRLSQARLDVQRMLQYTTDAETGQRGYLLTGREEFLGPFHSGLANIHATMDKLVRSVEADQPGQLPAVRELARTVEAKVSEMTTTVDLYREGRQEAAIALIASGIGREDMEKLRQLAMSLFDAQTALVSSERSAIYRTLMLSRLGIGLLVVLAVLGVFLYVRQSGQFEKMREDQSRHLKRERDRLEAEALQRTAELRELASHLQVAREDERGRLARELHDELGALLTAAKLDLARLRSKLGDRPELRERLEHLAASLNEGIALKRRIIEDLRPSSLSNLGLVPSLEILCRDMGDRLGVPIEARLDAIALEPPADLAVFRFVQEALTNVGKYAKAATVVVSLARQGDLIVVEVRDDGVGFDTHVAHTGRHGHSGQRFRVESLGGHMTISSQPGEGTVVRADLPVSAMVHAA